MITIGEKQIVIKKGDITNETTDAVVNAANEKLMHGGGVAGAIVRKGGNIVQKLSSDIVRKIGCVPVGKAVITNSGQLPCKFVIHTVCFYILL